MKLKTIISVFALTYTAVEFSLGGTLDPRFNGTWSGSETFVTEGMAFQRNFISRTFQAPAVLNVDEHSVTVTQGRSPGKYPILWTSRGTRLTYRPAIAHESTRTGQVKYFHPEREAGKLVLSADGQTLTETGTGIITIGITAQECTFRGEFHRVQMGASR